MATITPSPSGQSGSVSYKINGSDATPPFTRGAGTYSIRAEDESGCIDVKQVDVYAPDNCTNPITTYLDYRVDVYDNASDLILGPGVLANIIYVYSLGGNPVSGPVNLGYEKSALIWYYGIPIQLVPPSAQSELSRFARQLTWALAPAIYAHYDPVADKLYIQHKPDYFGSGFGRTAFYFTPHDTPPPPHDAVATQRFLIGEPSISGAPDPRIADGYGAVIENGCPQEIIDSFESQMRAVWSQVTELNRDASSATYELRTTANIANGLDFAGGAPQVITNRGPNTSQPIEVISHDPSRNAVTVRLNFINNCQTISTVSDGVNTGDVGSVAISVGDYIGEGGGEPTITPIPPSSTICPCEESNCIVREPHPENCFPQNFNEQSVYDEAVQLFFTPFSNDPGSRLIPLGPNPSSFRGIMAMQSWDANESIVGGTQFGAWTAPYFTNQNETSSYTTFNNVRFPGDSCGGANGINDTVAGDAHRLSRLFNRTKISTAANAGPGGFAEFWPSAFPINPPEVGCGNGSLERSVFVSIYPRFTAGISFFLPPGATKNSFFGTNYLSSANSQHFLVDNVASGSSLWCAPTQALNFPPVTQPYTTLNQGFVWQNGPIPTTGSGNGTEAAQTKPITFMAVDMRYGLFHAAACQLPLVDPNFLQNPNYPLCDNDFPWIGNVGVCGMNLATQERLWVRTENLFRPTRDCPKCAQTDPFSDLKSDPGCGYFQNPILSP